MVTPCSASDTVTTRLGVVVAYAEKALRRQLKEAGGMWNANTRLWQVSYESIRGTILEERITGRWHEARAAYGCTRVLI